MPVEYRTGNLFEYEGHIAHGTNGAGAMGKGIATEFKKFYPDMFEEYRDLCKAGKHLPGMIYPYSNMSVAMGSLPDPLPMLTGPGSVRALVATMKINTQWIYNICIKPHWKTKAETYAVWAGIRAALRHLQEHSPDNLKLAMPAIGCGLGGLDWETQVKPIIEEIGRESPCTLIVYLQSEAITDESANNAHDVDSSF